MKNEIMTKTSKGVLTYTQTQNFSFDEGYFLKLKIREAFEILDASFCALKEDNAEEEIFQNMI